MESEGINDATEHVMLIYVGEFFKGKMDADWI